MHLQTHPAPGEQAGFLPLSDALTSARRWTSCAGPQDQAHWDALSLMGEQPNPFYESWYLLPSLLSFDPGGRIRMVGLTAGETLVGLMPVHAPRTYYGHPLPHLGNWMHANCFLGSPLVAAGSEDAYWSALLDWADRKAGIALFLHLAGLPLQGPLIDSLRRVCSEQSRPAALVHREERAMLCSTLSPQAYFEQSLAAKKRKELRRQYNRLSELGALAFRREAGQEGIDGWTQAFLALEQAGWKGKAGSALASHPATAHLFAQAIKGAAERGRLERLSLTLDERPIAMLVNFITPAGAYSYKTAFDEEYARFSPGVLLQRENLALLTRSDIQWADSCAAQDHPMIDHFWRERRSIGRVSIAIGGKARRAVFGQIIRAETGKPPGGIP